MKVIQQRYHNSFFVIKVDTATDNNRGTGISRKFRKWLPK